MTSVTVLSDIPTDLNGWTVIHHMKNLLARLTQAEVHDLASFGSSKVERLLSPYSPRSRSNDERVAVCITVAGYSAPKFIPALRKLGGFSRVALWIVDSFWTDPVQQQRRVIDKHFDHVIYTQRYDRAFYEKLFGSRALCLECGSDALGLGTDDPDRDCDLQRIGRQPASWDDDEVNRADCTARGLRYRGRPPRDTTAESFAVLMKQSYSRTKFVLAHSNVAAPAPYTHPTKAYISGRWTDALACGASVAGMPPEGDLDLIDWPEALLRFPSLDRNVGLDLVAAAAEAWTPATAYANHLGALRTLDWRWRFRKLVDALGFQAPLLDADIVQLEARIASMSTIGGASGGTMG